MIQHIKKILRKPGKPSLPLQILTNCVFAKIFHWLITGTAQKIIQGIWVPLGSFSVCILVVTFLRNKPALVEDLGKGVRHVFNKSKIIYGSVVWDWQYYHCIETIFRANQWMVFRCNCNTGRKWQRGCMFKVNINL